MLILHTTFFYKIFGLLVVGLLIFIIFVNTNVKQTETAEIISRLKQSSSAIFAKSAWPSKHLLNLTNFEYLIENKICSNYEDELFAIMIVISSANHVELRTTHRNAITQKRLAELGMQRVFLLAAITEQQKSITQEQLIKEQQNFGDLVQGNFHDAYKNLSYKHIMGLQWAATECNKASFIIKIDDDVVHDIFHIKRYLENLQERNYTLATTGSLLAGVVWDNMPVLRDNTSKWYVTEEEYAPNFYPHYLSGSFYITNPATALRLVEQSKKVPMMWVDDAWVTGMLREPLGIPLTSLNSWITFNAAHIICCIRDLKASNLECEFSIGPVIGNSTLMIEFMRNVEKCYYYECVKRTKEQTLQDNCMEK